MARRLRDSHTAFVPQMPSSQMLTHRPPAQFCVLGHSSSCVHCGPQPVIVSGLGKKPALHLHTATPSGLTMQSVFGPHGYGVHGSLSSRPCQNTANQSRATRPLDSAPGLVPGRSAHQQHHREASNAPTSQLRGLRNESTKNNKASADTVTQALIRVSCFQYDGDDDPLTPKKECVTRSYLI